MKNGERVGNGSERRIPSISRPATQATESNKGVSHVVMLRGPVKKRSQKREQTVESTKRSSFI